MRRALVTGAGGFVGANLVGHLVGLGVEVVALTRPGGDPWRLAGSPAEVREVDLADGEAAADAVADARPDAVFHLAAHGAYSWQDDLGAMLAVNVAATARLLEACRRAGAVPLVHAGSSSEYGRKRDAPAEDALLEPNSHYAVTKAAATHLCALARARGEVPATTLRLYSAYGPWEEPRRLVPTLLSHALAGTLPPLVAPETARDFVYVEDVCEAFVLAARSPVDAPPVFNVGSGRQTTLRELVETVRERFAVKAEPAWGAMEARDWDTDRWLADPATIAAALGWRARTPLVEGLERTASWMRGRGA